MSRVIGDNLTTAQQAEANLLLTHNPFVYKGYYYDSETGYYYLKSRYYDPRIHRFISADKIDYLDPQSLSSLNLYVYCGDNPVMMMDENGTIPLIGTIIGGILGGLWGAVSAAINGQNIWNGLLIGALTGALTGLAIDTLGGSSLLLSTFALGAIGDAANQVFTEKKIVGDINIIQSLTAGLTNMGLSRIGSDLSRVASAGTYPLKGLSNILFNSLTSSPLMFAGFAFNSINSLNSNKYLYTLNDLWSDVKNLSSRFKPIFV